MKRVLVVIVTYNGLRWLQRCLDSVVKDADLFVVDNHSSDGSADFVAEHYPQAQLIRSQENLLFSQPNNMGFRWAVDHGYDYVYLLNQDAWLEEGTLEKLVSRADACPQYAVLSPMQMTDGYRNNDREFDKVYAKGRLGPDGLVCVPRVMAAHWLVPVAAVRKVGLFHETLFPLYGQDDDWCNRSRFHGFRLGIVPEARAVHDRAYREEPMERLVYRNYYTGSLVRLADPNHPLVRQFLYVCLFTVVKACKYRSLSPFRYFGRICKEMDAIRAARRPSL